MVCADSVPRGGTSRPEGWSRLSDAGLVAKAIRVQRVEIAYFKYLFESYEGVAIVRTVRTEGRETAVIAILATPDFVAEAETILRDVETTGSPEFELVPLPPECTEDWFLATWVRDPVHSWAGARENR